MYVVKDPTPVVTFGARPADRQVVENERIAATGSSDGGTAFVRRNWFPRWRAAVNGRTASIAETDDGYMTVPVPAGPVQLELTYALGPMDVFARALMLIGAVIAAALARASPQ